MDPNLTWQRAIKSAKNSVLVKKQQSTIKRTVKSYEIEVVRRETSRSFKDKDCPCCVFIELMKEAGAQLTIVTVLNIASQAISKKFAVFVLLNLLKRL